VSAQKSPWDVSGLRELGNNSKSVSRADRAVIAKRLRAKPDEFRIERIQTAGTHIFVVQYLGEDYCGGTGNCSFTVLDAAYRVVLDNIAQTFKIETVLHHGMPDILTGMHDSAVESVLKLWRFNGKYYERAACADVVYGDLTSDATYPHPRVTEQSCKRLFGG